MLLALCGSGCAHCGRAPDPPSQSIWVSAYYTAQSQLARAPAPTDIDYGALTHIIHFSVRPTATGDLDGGTDLMLHPELSTDAVQAAHAAGRKILLCVGGSAGSTYGAQFLSALGDGARDNLVANLVVLVTARGYDGLDVDCEPLDATVSGYPLFITALRARLPSGALLTATSEPSAALAAVFSPIQSSLDQINVRTYNLSSAKLKESWHNSALFGIASPLTGNQLPSWDGTLADWSSIDRRRLGLGIDFHGKLWTGPEGPDQPYSSSAQPAALSFSAIMDGYYSTSAHHWHRGPEVPYLSLSGQFVSYDDEASVARKIAYARSAPVGGVILWELSGGWRPAATPPDPLLQSIKRAALGP
jgi:chitinase